MRFTRSVAVATAVGCAMLAAASTTLAGGGDKSKAVSLRFLTQPNDAVINVPISGTAYVSTAPFVTVEIVDSHRNVVDSSAAVRIKLGNNPGGASLSGTTTVNAVHGVATFTTLQLDKPDNGYTLVASGHSLKSSTSSAFDTANTAVVCDQGESCSTSLSTPESSFAVEANPVPSTDNAGTLSESVNVGMRLTCKGYARDPNWWEFVSSSINRSKVITYTINNTSPDGIQVCFGAPYKFKTSSGQFAQSSKLPDGSSGFTGLLPVCNDDGYRDQSGPCVQSTESSSQRSGEGGYDTIVTVQIPAGLAGDPWMHG